MVRKFPQKKEKNISSESSSEDDDPVPLKSDEVTETFSDLQDDSSSVLVQIEPIKKAIPKMSVALEILYFSCLYPGRITL